MREELRRHPNLVLFMGACTKVDQNGEVPGNQKKNMVKKKRVNFGGLFSWCFCYFPPGEINIIYILNHHLGNMSSKSKKRWGHSAWPQNKPIILRWWLKSFTVR